MKKNAIAYLVLALSLVGCRKGSVSDSTIPEVTVASTADHLENNSLEYSPDSDEDGKKQTSAETVVASNHITWELGFYGVPDSKGCETINRILFEKGYDCEVNFVKTGAYAAGMEPSWQEAYEVDHSPIDILFTGSWNTNQSEAIDYVQDKYVPLTEYLDTEEGRPLKDFFTPYEWAYNSYGGVIYAIPLTISPVDTAASSYLYVADRYAEEFDGYDGSYSKLMELFMCLHRDDEVIVLQEIEALESFMEYQRFLYRIPYDPLEQRFITASEMNNDCDMINCMMEDLRRGRLALPQLGKIEDEQVFAFVNYGKIKIEGYTGFPLNKAACYINYNMSYGVSKKSEKQDLALKILTACYTDPEIAEIMLPEMNGQSGISSRRDLMLTEEIGPIQNFAPLLTDEQKNLISQYPYMTLFSDMLVCIYDKELQMERWVINDGFDINAIMKSMDTPEYQDLLKELNTQITEYLKKCD